MPKEIRTLLWNLISCREISRGAVHLGHIFKERTCLEHHEKERHFCSINTTKNVQNQHLETLTNHYFMTGTMLHNCSCHKYQMCTALCCVLSMDIVKHNSSSVESGLSPHNKQVCGLELLCVQFAFSPCQYVIRLSVLWFLSAVQRYAAYANKNLLFCPWTWTWWYRVETWPGFTVFTPTLMHMTMNTICTSNNKTICVFKTTVMCNL